jgi:hypothetical protein
LRRNQIVCVFCDDYIGEMLEKVHTHICNIDKKEVNNIINVKFTLDEIRKNRVANFASQLLPKLANPRL